MTLQNRLANVPRMFSEGVEDLPDAGASRRGARAILGRRLRAAAAALLPSVGVPMVGANVRSPVQAV